MLKTDGPEGQCGRYRGRRGGGVVSSSGRLASFPLLLAWLHLLLCPRLKIILRICLGPHISSCYQYSHALFFSFIVMARPCSLRKLSGATGLAYIPAIARIWYAMLV